MPLSGPIDVPKYGLCAPRKNSRVSKVATGLPSENRVRVATSAWARRLVQTHHLSYTRRSKAKHDMEIRYSRLCRVRMLMVRGRGLQ